MGKDDTSEAKVLVIEKQCDEKGMRITGFDKWLIAIVIAIVFFILASPFIFKLTNKGTKMIGFNTIDNSGVTTSGLFLHTIIFLVVIRLLMH